MGSSLYEAGDRLAEAALELCTAVLTGVTPEGFSKADLAAKTRGAVSDWWFVGQEPLDE
jgi:hypothetical protein